MFEKEFHTFGNHCPDALVKKNSNNSNSSLVTPIELAGRTSSHALIKGPYIII